MRDSGRTKRSSVQAWRAATSHEIRKVAKALRQTSCIPEVRYAKGMTCDLENLGQSHGARAGVKKRQAASGTVKSRGI